MSEPIFPETFVVQRDEDVSGISGEGVVAEGVQWSDGWVATHWLDKPPMHQPKTDVWHRKGTAPFERIHGHDGRTRIVWANDVAAARGKAVADVAEAFDVPAHLLGTEAELTHLREQIIRALTDEHLRRAHQEIVGSPEEHCAGFADVVMPIVAQLLQQRDRAHAAAGRAYQLADRWQAAHGSSMFLVRAAGAELHDALDEDARAPRLDPADSAEAAIGRLRTVVEEARSRALPRSELASFVRRTEEALGDFDPRDVCPYCTGGPQFRRSELGSHIDQKHARVLAALAIGNLDDQLSGGRDAATAEQVYARVRRDPRADDPTGLREQYADALWEASGPAAAEDANVDAVLAVRDRELEKARAAREQLRAQRNDLAQALREALAAFRAVNDEATRATVGYVSAPVHPCNFDRWRKVLAQAPANCRKPGGCADCPHETEA